MSNQCVYLLFIVLCVTGCGGSSSSGTESSTDSVTTEILSDLNSDNANAQLLGARSLGYASALDQVFEELILTENSNSTDTTSLDAFLLELQAAATAITDLESSTESNYPTSIHVASQINDENEFNFDDERALTLAGCAAVLSTAAVVAAHTDTMKKIVLEVKACTDQYSVDVNNVGISEARRNAYNCLNQARANSGSHMALFFANVGIGKLLSWAGDGPEQVRRGLARAASATSGISDLGTLYHLGVFDRTQSEPEPMPVPDAIVHSRLSGPLENYEFFIGQTDSNGVMELPVGKWQLVSVDAGNLPVTTNIDQTIPIDEGQVTTITLPQIKLDGLNANQYQTCNAPVVESEMTPQPDPDPVETNGFQVMRVNNYSGFNIITYITVQTESEVSEPPLLSGYPGGGRDPELLAQLAPISEDTYDSATEAAQSWCDQISCFYTTPLASFIQKAVTSIGNVSISPVFVSACPSVPRSCP